MKTVKLVLSVAVLAAFAACSSSLSVKSDYDRTADFKKFKTFSFYKNDKVTKSTVSSLNQDRIFSAIRAELTKKGYKEATSNADFWVNVNTIITNEKSYTANTDFYGYGGMYRPYMWGGMGNVSATTTFDATSYKDGSIIIDLVDASTNKMFWEGIGNKEIDGASKNPDQDINAAITKILASFPSAGVGVPATK